MTGYLHGVQHHYIQGLPVQSSEHPGLTEAASSTGSTRWFHSSLPNLIITNFLNKFDSNFSEQLVHNAWSRVFGSHNEIFIENIAICNYLTKLYCNVIGLRNHKKKSFCFFLWWFGFFLFIVVVGGGGFFFQIVRFLSSFGGCLLTVLLLISANTPCFL